MNFGESNSEYQEDTWSEKEPLKRIIKKLKEENAQLRSFIMFLKPHIVSLLSENCQLKETLETYSSSKVLGSIFTNEKVSALENSQNIGLQHNSSSRKIKLELGEDLASMEQTWNNLKSDVLVKNSATEKAKQVWKKFFVGEEPSSSNLNTLDISNIEGFGTRMKNLTNAGILNPTPYLCPRAQPESKLDVESLASEILRSSFKEKKLLEVNQLWEESTLSENSGLAAKQNHRKKKRRARRWTKSVIGPRKRKRVEYMCSKCGPFKACPSQKNPNRVQHNCSELPEPQTTNTLGKIHRRTGALVVLGRFTKEEMEIKLEEARKL